MPIANAAQNVAAQPRKPYQPPQLTVFGPLSKLTQNGTGSTDENNGKKTCGVNFMVKGGSGC